MARWRQWASQLRRRLTAPFRGSQQWKESWGSPVSLRQRSVWFCAVIRKQNCPGSSWHCRVSISLLNQGMLAKSFNDNTKQFYSTGEYSRFLNLHGNDFNFYFLFFNLCVCVPLCVCFCLCLSLCVSLCHSACSMYHSEYLGPHLYVLWDSVLCCMKLAVVCSRLECPLREIFLALHTAAL